MTSRERVFAALAHQQPDRCPVDLMLETATLKTLLHHFHVKSEQELHDIFETDIQFVFPASTSGGNQVLPDGTWYDLFGARFRLVENGYCQYAERIFYPLAEAQDLETLKKYDRWPDAAAFDWAHFAEQIGDLHEKRVIKLHTGGLYEVAWGLRGQEQLLIDMVLDPDIPHYIMDKICNYWCEFVRYAMNAAGDKIDIVYTYDDIAARNTLLMSPRMLEEFVYPYHRKLNATIKSYGKKILYHSCGSVDSQIDNLRTLPIDILNPLQPLAAGMDFSLLKNTWGDKLCFHGGIDIQELLPNGSPEDVRAAVKNNIATLGKNGGYILAPAHYIQNDTPVKNILAMYDVSIR